MADFTDRASRFVTEQSTNSTLKDDVVANDEFQDGTISGIANQSKSSSSPNKKDDGISGERMAIIFKSVKLDGIHQIQDPGILDVVSSIKGQQTTVFVHYGFAAGTSVTLPRDRLADVTKMSRFYELLTNSDTEFTDRDGHTAKVEMIGTNHGRVVNFMEEGVIQVVDRTPAEEPPAPLAVVNNISQPEENIIQEIPEQNKTLDDYLQEVEHKDYTLVQTGRKADVGKQDLWKIQLDGDDLLENRYQRDSLVMTNTKEAWEALIRMEESWDRLRVIYRFNKYDMANTDWIPMIDFISNSYRSIVVNDTVRGGHPNSQHKNGTAFDVHRASRIDKKLWARLFVYAGSIAGFTSFGIGTGFCHADTRKQKVSWDYGSNVSSYAPKEFLVNGKVRGDLAAKVDNAALDLDWGSDNWKKAFT